MPVSGREQGRGGGGYHGPHTEAPRGIGSGNQPGHGNVILSRRPFNQGLITLSEAQIIRQACGGESAAIRMLYERYSPRVYAVVRRIAGDDDLAQDYAQEAWIRAIRALPTFRGDSRFSTWLHRIAVNSALQALRKSGNREKRQAPMPDAIPVGPGMGDTLLSRRLEAAMDQLPSGMREVLILHDVEGYTHEEIGDVLGVTSGTSKSQLFKARARMRKLLSGIDTQDLQHGAEAWNT